MRHLGIDYGTKRVGLAVSDEEGTMGFPYTIIQNSESLVDDLCTIVQKEHIEKIVIGESKNLDGSDNPVANEARALGDLLGARMGLPVKYESEVFTSEAARVLPHKTEKTRAPRKHEPVDASAAALILSAYLEGGNHD